MKKTTQIGIEEYKNKKTLVLTRVFLLAHNNVLIRHESPAIRYEPIARQIFFQNQRPRLQVLLSPTCQLLSATVLRSVVRAVRIRAVGVGAVGVGAIRIRAGQVAYVTVARRIRRGPGNSHQAYYQKRCCQNNQKFLLHFFSSLKSVNITTRLQTNINRIISDISSMSRFLKWVYS